MNIQRQKILKYHKIGKKKSLFFENFRFQKAGVSKVYNIWT